MVVRSNSMAEDKLCLCFISFSHVARNVGRKKRRRLLGKLEGNFAFYYSRHLRNLTYLCEVFVNHEQRRPTALILSTTCSHCCLIVKRFKPVAAFEILVCKGQLGLNMRRE